MSEPLRDYFCFVLDFPGKYEARMKIRPSHVETVLKNGEKGILQFAGALADEYPEEGQPPQFKGSAVVVRAANKAEVIEFLKQDIFYTEGVWDVDNAQINAVFTTVRKPL